MRVSSQSFFPGPSITRATLSCYISPWLRVVEAIDQTLGLQCGTQNEYLSDWIMEGPSHTCLRGNIRSDLNDRRLDASRLGCGSGERLDRPDLTDKTFAHTRLIEVEGLHRPPDEAEPAEQLRHRLRHCTLLHQHYERVSMDRIRAPPHARPDSCGTRLHTLADSFATSMAQTRPITCSCPRRGSPRRHTAPPEPPP